MRWFAQRRRGEEPEAAAPQGVDTAFTAVEGERGVSVVGRPPSLQTRVSNLLAFALMATIGLGLLIWYYANIVVGSGASRVATSRLEENAAAEITLRPLGRVEPPRPSALETLLGDRPIEPPPEAGVVQPAPQPPRQAYSTSKHS